MNHESERRRVARVAPEEAFAVSLDTTMPVQIIDISQLGLQLSSKFALTVGDRGELTTTIGGKDIRIPVEVRRVHLESNSRGAGTRFVAGAVFGPMSLEQRMFLKRVLGAEPA